MSIVAAPLPVRRRSDVDVSRQSYDGEIWWIVRDPLTLRFVRLREPEYFLWQLLDGRRSLIDLADEYAVKFSPRRVRPAELRRFIERLQRSGLVWVDRPGQGDWLYRRGREERARERRGRWSNPLAVRFRGIDPTRLFDRLEPWTRPLFTKKAACFAAATAGAALMLVVTNWSEFIARLPSFHAFFTPSNLLLLVAVLGMVKVLHEFGHGLACRRFGGECHELGLMLLIFTPCLYCNVTDAWRFPNKWHRAAVGAAGIYIELLLASIATFLWWFSQAGLLNQVCFGVMLVGSVSTVVFNGNPLLRYDGYYVLADVVEAPNLAGRASAVLRRLWARLFLRDPDDADPLLPAHRRGWYAVYGFASACYRWSITLSILFLMIEAARPHHLENVVRAFGVLALAGLTLAPLRRAVTVLRQPSGGSRVRFGRVAATVALAASIVAVIGFVPIARHAVGPVELRSYRPRHLYVETAGRLEESPLRYGRLVEAGQLIARLESPELDLVIDDLAARGERLRAELRSMRREQFDRSGAGGDTRRLEQALGSVEEQLRLRSADRERLRIVAPAAGVLLPPPTSDRPAESGQLPPWTGCPLDAENSGCTLAPGTLLGEVAVPGRFEAALILTQDEVASIRVGDPVALLLDAAADRTIAGAVEEIAASEVVESPRRLSGRHGGEVASSPRTDAGDRPLVPSYIVRIGIADPEDRLRVGWSGTGRIRLEPEPLGSRLSRWVAKTVHCRL